MIIYAKETGIYYLEKITAVTEDYVWNTRITEDGSRRKKASRRIYCPTDRKAKVILEDEKSAACITLKSELLGTLMPEHQKNLFLKQKIILSIHGSHQSRNEKLKSN